MREFFIVERDLLAAIITAIADYLRKLKELKTNSLLLGNKVTIGNAEYL